MAFFAYVLYSADHKRFYKGHCADLTERLKQHNHGHTNSTKPFIPWEIVYFEEFENRNDAINREKYFKTAAGGFIVHGKHDSYENGGAPTVCWCHIKPAITVRHAESLSNFIGHNEKMTDCSKPPFPPKWESFSLLSE